MTDKKKERTEQETALAAQKFLETIGETMTKLEIHPRFAVSLFGFFARRVVEIEVEAGAEEPGINIQVLQAFTEGLGLQNGFVEMKGEAAEQLKAQIDLQNSDTPLQ